MYFSLLSILAFCLSILLAKKERGLKGVMKSTCKVASLWDVKLLELHPLPSQHVAFLRAANRWLCGETDGTETYKTWKFSVVMQQYIKRWHHCNKLLKKESIWESELMAHEKPSYCENMKHIDPDWATRVILFFVTFTFTLRWFTNENISKVDWFSLPLTWITKNECYSLTQQQKDCDLNVYITSACCLILSDPYLSRCAMACRAT